MVVPSAIHTQAEMEQYIYEMMTSIAKDALLKTSFIANEEIPNLFQRCQDNSWDKIYKKMRFKQLWLDCSKRSTSMVQPAQTQAYENVRREQIWFFCCEKITSMAQGIIEFAKMTPGYMKLPQDDQIALLKSSVFEMILIRLSCYMDLSTGKLLVIEDGMMLPEMAFYTNDTDDMKLVVFVFALVKSIAKLKLTTSQLGLFSALILARTDCPELKSPAAVRRMRDLIVYTLDRQLDITMFDEIVAKIEPLRQASRMHMNALIKFKHYLQKYERFPNLHRELFELEPDNIP